MLGRETLNPVFILIFVTVDGSFGNRGCLVNEVISACLMSLHKSESIEPVCLHETKYSPNGEVAEMLQTAVQFTF